MKLCAKFSVFPVVFLVVILMVSLVMPGYAITEPAVRKAGLAHQAMTFNRILKQIGTTVSATAVMTPTDATSTGTVSVYMLPAAVEYPVLLRIQNHGAESLTYVPYVSTIASGVVLPTATTAGVLLNPAGAIVKSGLAYEQVFYEAPAFVVGAASNTSSIVVEVLGRKGTE